MGAVPKKKHTRARSNRRRNSPSRRRATIPNLSPCPNCKKLRKPHIACPSCGHYK